MKSVDYQNDKTQPGYCPNEAEALEVAIVGLARKTKDAICNTAKTSKAYTDENVAELTKKVEAIVQVEGITEKIAKLDELIKAIDADENGNIINELQALIEQSKLTIEKADAVGKDVDVLKSEVSDLKTTVIEGNESTEKQLGEVRTELNTVREAIAETDAKTDKLGESLVEAKGKTAEVAKAVIDLETKFDQLDDGYVTEQEVTDLVCESRTKLVEAVERAVTKFDEIFAEVCE